MVRNFLSRLRHDAVGSMVIETAIIVPVLAVLSLATFDVSRMFSRQNELQQAMAEAAQIALASKPDNSTKRDTLKSIIRTSTGLGSGQVTVTNEYRCGSNSTISATNNCGTADVVTTYVKIVVTDAYTPVWTDFGIGSGFSYNITRRIIVA